jgi:outer membrane protein assembly factor BamB
MTRRLFVVDPASDLYTLDPATASPRRIGPTGMAQVTDIAFHGPTLYGVGFSQLLRLNPETGAASVIGNIGLATTNGLAVASDGTIYAATTNGELVRLNPVTGAGTVVGTFGGGRTSSGDLAFDSSDVLYGALNSSGSVVLATIDRATGGATDIGPTGLGTLYGLAFSCCRLYGASSAGELVEINVATGRATVIGRNALTHWGMAARPCCGC